MDKNYKQSKLSKFSIPYSIENLSSPLKTNKLKNKEIILNSFLQETYNQKKSKAKANLLYEKMIGEQNSNKMYLNIIEKKEKNHEKKKINSNNNRDKLLTKNDIPLTSYYKKKQKNKIDILDNNLSNFQVVNTFLNRNNSNKSSVFLSNENQMSFLINSKNLEQKNDIKNSEEKKIKRHKTVYIKKNLSVERNIKISKNIYKNISHDDKYYHSNKKMEQKYSTPSTMRKRDKDISKENNTNNINSNVNIFNFGMQYNNSPNYLIRNSKMFNPYFNDFLAYNNPKIDFHENYIDRMEESAIMIQSVFRGSFIRFKLKAYKGIEILILCFRNKFWKLLKKKILLLKIADSNNKRKSIIYNQKFLKESKESFCFLNRNKIKNFSYEENYLGSYENINKFEDNKNKKLIWNKKMANKNNPIISNIINQKLFSKNIKKLKVEKKDNSLTKEKEKFLKILVTKKNR